MSEFNARNLWKIPHFHDNMKYLRSLTWPLAVTFLLLLAAGTWFALQPAQATQWLSFLPPGWRPEWEALSQTSEAPEDEANRQLAIAQGNRLLQQARFRWMRYSGSLTASVLQILQTPDQTFQATGRYAQASNGKSRLEVEMRLPGVTGRLWQISDGQVVWQIQEFQLPAQAAQLKYIGSTELPPPGDDGTVRDRRIDRVDLQRIMQYAQSLGLTLDDPRIAREMLGGLAGLLAALEQEMDFRLVKKVALEQETFFILEGEWKQPLASKSYQNSTYALAAFQANPDKIRIYLRENDLLPVRYVCLKKKPNQRDWYTPLAMELTDIRKNDNTDSTLFNYSPAEDLVPNDITHEYLQRLQTTFAPEETDTATSATP